MIFLNLTLTFCSKDKLKQHISAIEKKGKRQVAMIQSKNMKEHKDVRSAHIEEINTKDKEISVMFIIKFFCARYSNYKRSNNSYQVYFSVHYECSST